MLEQKSEGGMSLQSFRLELGFPLYRIKVESVCFDQDFDLVIVGKGMTIRSFGNTN